MNPSQPNPEHRVDALVRTYLQRQAESVDAAALAVRVRATLNADAASPAKTADLGAGKQRRRRVLLWLSATAAAIFLAFLSGTFLGPVRASAESLVREAKRVHALPVDRCYLVQSIPDPEGVLARFPRLMMPRETRLWTRGDRFFMESTSAARTGALGNGPREWAWGRDELGRVWLALGRDEGLRFDPAEGTDADELPRFVSIACDVCAMQVETLLDEVLTHFDLRRETTEGTGPAATHPIRAEPKHGARSCPWLRGALLEIDAESGVLRRLVLHRTRAGQPLATVTFTLVETHPQSEERYTLEGHLRSGVVPYSATYKPLQRARLTALSFGLLLNRPLAVDGPKTQKASEPAPEFTLLDAKGEGHTSKEWADHKAIVVFFVNTDCPVSNHHAPDMERLAKDYADKGILFWCVYPDPDVNAEAAGKHAKDYGLTFPGLLDPSQVLARKVGARVTPEAFVLAPSGKVLYRGRIDNRYSPEGKRREEPSTHELVDAIEAVLTGKAPPVAETKAYGCPLPKPGA